MRRARTLLFPVLPKALPGPVDATLGHSPCPQVTQDQAEALPVSLSSDSAEPLTGGPRLEPMGAGEAVGGWEDGAHVEAALAVMRQLVWGSQRSSRRGSGCTVGQGCLVQGVLR